MHHLSDAGVLDEFFVFLKDLGMLEAFEQVSQSGVQRTLVPTVQFVLLYFLKVLLGGESMNELPRVLLSDLALMELVGFNAYQCENGLTKRGDASRKTKKKQGPLTAQCLADNICKITQEEMERLFNRMVQQEVSLFSTCANRTRRNHIAAIAAKMRTKSRLDCHHQAFPAQS